MSKKKTKEVKKYVCERKCLWGETAPTRKIWVPGEIYEGTATPNSHFREQDKPKPKEEGKEPSVYDDMSVEEIKGLLQDYEVTIDQRWDKDRMIEVLEDVTS